MRWAWCIEPPQTQPSGASISRDGGGGGGAAADGGTGSSGSESPSKSPLLLSTLSSESRARAKSTSFASKPRRLFSSLWRAFSVCAYVSNVKGVK